MKKIKTPGSCIEYLALTEKQKLQLLKQDPPPVQSDQSPDEDRREKSESQAGIPPFERGGPANH
jgi:hypothetical protein